MQGFNPKIGFYLGILVTIEIAVSSGTISLTHAIAADWIPTVVAWSGILAFAGSTILTFLHGYSSAQAGPLVGAPVVKAAIALLAFGLASALLAPATAHAQTKAKTLPMKIGASAPAPQQPANPFENISQDLLAKILADVTYAKALAKQSNNQVTLPCWSAWVDLVNSQTRPVTDDAGNALAEPNPHFFTAAERASEFVNQLQPNSPLNIGCGAALNQSKIAVSQMIGAVLSGGALGLFKIP